jgi:hypothetical protein
MGRFVDRISIRSHEYRSNHWPKDSAMPPRMAMMTTWKENEVKALVDEITQNQAIIPLHPWQVPLRTKK